MLEDEMQVRFSKGLSQCFYKFNQMHTLPLIEGIKYKTENEGIFKLYLVCGRIKKRHKTSGREVIKHFSNVVILIDLFKIFG